MRVVIADDDATSRVALKAIASKLGHKCLIVNDGSSAWELLETKSVDVLLTDWMMPGLDGPELCRRVRQDLRQRYIYIALITVLDNPMQILEGMNAGADDYLIKPVDPFAVQTRLVAAQRITALHRELVEVRSQLEQVNLELLGQSLTDPLTGIGNRRRMEEDLARAHAQALRYGRPYSIALFDIDHFKLYNDHYGHLAGDETLRQVARCLHQSVRAGESIYRFGGEEFLVLLADCLVDGAIAAADRIRVALADAAIAHAVRPSPPPVVTISGGLSCWSPRILTTHEMLQLADEALFRAKSLGRNRVQAYEPNATAGTGPPRKV